MPRCAISPATNLATNSLVAEFFMFQQGVIDDASKKMHVLIESYIIQTYFFQSSVAAIWRLTQRHLNVSVTRMPLTLQRNAATMTEATIVSHSSKA